MLDDTLQQAFKWVADQNQCWVAGESITVPNTREFQALLSGLCDHTYDWDFGLTVNLSTAANSPLRAQKLAES